MDNGIGHADVAQELIAQTLAAGGTLYQTSDVHELNNSGSGLLGVIHLGQLVQTIVRNRHHTHIGVDGAEGIVGTLSASVGNSIKQGALAHVGQTHDT